MTKATTSAVTAPAAPETPAVAKKPFAIRIGAPANVAFNQAITLARQGYTFSDAPIEMTPTGFAWFTLVKGDPDQYSINKANEAMEQSRDEEEREHHKAVQEEARRIVEQEKREALERQVKEAEQDLQRQIAALRKKTEAEIAQIEATAAAERARLN